MNSGTTVNLTGVWGTASTNVYAVGGVGGSSRRGEILHYDGHSWALAQLFATPDLMDIWGTSENDMFVVGADETGALVLRSQGAGWASLHPDLEQTLNAVWGTSSQDVFAGSDGATIIHFNGNVWSSMGGVPSSNDITGIWGTSPQRVFAADSVGPLLRYDGNRWFTDDTTAGKGFEYVWGSSATNVFAVADNLIYHRCGTGW
jgi:hypothetical protein